VSTAHDVLLRRGRRGIAAAAVGAAVVWALLLSGCGAGESHQAEEGASTGPPSVSERHVDWTTVITDLNCSPMNRGVEIDGVLYGDVRGSGTDDALVWADCVHYTSPWPYQLEVFDGRSNAANPTRLAVLVSPTDQMIIKSVAVGDRSIAVNGLRWDSRDPSCCPSLRIGYIFTWQDGRFVRTTASPP